MEQNYLKKTDVINAIRTTNDSTTVRYLFCVVHVQNEEQTERNLEIAKRSGAAGVFLINHGISYTSLFTLFKSMRAKHPDYFIGINILGIPSPLTRLELLKQHDIYPDAIWFDNAEIIEHSQHDQPIAEKIKKHRADLGFNDVLYFGGVAFKYQAKVQTHNLKIATAIATKFVDVVTTSGAGTGVAAEIEKIQIMSECVQALKSRLGVASGITNENVAQYLPYIDLYLVATGISINYHELDEVKVRSLTAKMAEYVANKSTNNGI
jgi:hypothetical protein